MLPASHTPTIVDLQSVRQALLVSEQLSIRRAADQLVAVQQHRADVAFVLATSEAPGAESEHLWDEPVSVALPETHALAERQELSWADLDSQNFVVRAYGSGPFIYAWLAARF